MRNRSGHRRPARVTSLPARCVALPPTHPAHPQFVRFGQLKLAIVLAFCTALWLMAGLARGADASQKSDAAGTTATEQAGETGWQAGFGRVKITPEKPMFASGYGGRNKPTSNTVQDLYARAAALRDADGNTVVIIGLDLIGVPDKTMASVISEQVHEKHGIPRASLMFASSHTHCGPALDDMLSHMMAISEDDWKVIREHQTILNGKVIQAIDDAIADLAPARVDAGAGTCGFASNRRVPRGVGPYDHSVPVLRVTTPDGSRVRGLVYGYACHNTVLGFYNWCGDYAGFASAWLEDRYPDAVAVFFAGCGADQNPLPRRTVERAEKYGRMLGYACQLVMRQPMQPVAPQAKTAFSRIDLAFHEIPTEERIRAELRSSSRYARARAGVLLARLEDEGRLSPTYPYPVQVWRLGDNVTWVALGGEVVVDYSLRLKQELDSPQVWVAGYANDVMAYIPSERVLEEGGYEGDSSMIVYQQPSKWKTGLEDQIVSEVRRLTRELGGQTRPATKPQEDTAAPSED